MCAESVNALLPPEVLRRIFEEAYASQPSPYGPTNPLSLPHLGSSISEDVKVTELRNEVRQAAFFPYSLASVCDYWDAILASTPAFWTFVVLFLDREATALERAEELLRRSGDLPISVFMTRRPGMHIEPSHAEAEESETVSRNMTILAPHLHRCKTLHIDVTFNSSLPILSKSATHNLPLLRHLSFESDINLLAWDPQKQEHNFRLDPTISYNPNNTAQGSFPRLRALTIDGRNVLSAFRASDTWLEHQYDLVDLTIANYSPIVTCSASSSPRSHSCDPCGLDVDSVIDIIATAPRMTRMTLKSLVFKPVVQNRRDSMPGLQEIIQFPSLTSMTFEDMEPVDITMVLSYADAELLVDELELTIIRCPRIHEARMPVHQINTLRFVKLPDDVDLASVLRDWCGQNLTFENCQSFSDATLQFLSSQPQVQTTFGNSHPELNCHGMRSLVLHFDTVLPFTVTALRQTIASRGSHIDYATSWKDHPVRVPALLLLHVTGQLPELSDADREWFDTHLISFRWGNNQTSS